jgi:hypothetical protein
MNLRERVEDLEEDIGYGACLGLDRDEPVRVDARDEILRAFREVAREASRKTFLEDLDARGPDEIADSVLAEMEAEAEPPHGGR